MIADNGEDSRLMTLEMNASVLFVNHQKETPQRSISWNWSPPTNRPCVWNKRETAITKQPILPSSGNTTSSPVPESVDRELDKCDYLHQAREALHHLSTEMNEEMQLKRRFEDSTPAYRQKQFCEGVKRITEMKGSFLHLTKEQLVKILVAISGVL